MQNLRVIVYASAAIKVLNKAALHELRRVSRTRNLAAGVSGLLLHADGNFLEYLEGEHDRLAPIWESIQRDPRHHRVNVLLDGPIKRREFRGWSMVYGNADLPEFLSQPGAQRDGEAAEHAAPPLSAGKELIRAMWAAMLPGSRGG